MAAKDQRDPSTLLSLASTGHGGTDRGDSQQEIVTTAPTLRQSEAERVSCCTDGCDIPQFSSER